MVGHVPLDRNDGRPDPDAAYADAIRAVEKVICPIGLPNDKLSIFDKASNHLRDAL